jgi:hypothetical protein
LLTRRQRQMCIRDRTYADRCVGSAARTELFFLKAHAALARILGSLRGISSLVSNLASG